MLKNYIKIALRKLLQQKNYTLLHLTGLSIGVTACLLIASYVWHEYQYDRIHEKGKRIYRVNTDLIYPDQTLQLALAAGPVAPALQEELPGIEDFVRLARPWSKLLVQRHEEGRYEPAVLYADSSFFGVFDFPLLSGDPATALAGPNRLVLTASKAQAWFGDTDPIGKQLIVDGKEYQIAGVVANPSRNSHLQFDILLSFASWVSEHPPTNSNWGWTSFPSYVILREGVDPADVAGQLGEFLSRHVPEDASMRMALHIQPFESIHFGASRLGELQPLGNKNILIFLSLTAIFILLLSVVNYLNLAMAVHIRRTREIGIRKALGATGVQIGQQYLLEGILLCLFSVAIAVGLTYTLLPVFSEWLNRELIFTADHTLVIGGLLLGFAIVLGLLVAAYPATMAALMQPVAIFQGKSLGSLDKSQLRRGLTVIQFAIAIALLTGSMVVWRQLNYMAKKDLGFDRRGKLVIDFGKKEALNQSLDGIRSEFYRVPGVQKITFSSDVPAQAPHNVGTRIRKPDGQELSAELDLFLIDYDFIDVYGLKMVAGRKFMPEFTQDTAGALILSRSAVERLGFTEPEEVVGLEFAQWDWQGRVVGVVEDFNYQSLHQKAGPISFQIRPELFEKITVQLSSRDLSSVLKQLERSWAKVAGHLPFQYSFLDEGLAAQYTADKRLGQIISLATILALLLACLGLTGLVAYTCRQQAKSIAVRKVLGASHYQIIQNLIHEFGRPVLWAWLLAIGPAYWALDQWLESFAYQLPISWWLLAGGGLVVLLLISMVIVGQSYGTVRSSPVKFLKEE